MDETHIVNEVKEKMCFVSKTFVDDLEACRCVPKALQSLPLGLTSDHFIFHSRDPLNNAHRLDYVLPDFASSSRMHGYVKRVGPARPQTEDEMAVDQQTDEQVLSLGSERFSVPEILFNPSDIGEVSPFAFYLRLKSSHLTFVLFFVSFRSASSWSGRGRCEFDLEPAERGPVPLLDQHRLVWRERQVSQPACPTVRCVCLPPPMVLSPH